MKSFAFHKPTTVADAVALLATGDDPRFLAGGMTLLPTMKQGLATPEVLVDLSGMPELVAIRDLDGMIEIGAMTPHIAVATSALVKARIPALAMLAAGIGDPAVRNRGTIGGSVANNDPSADYPAAVLGLAATIVTDRRTIVADDFFVDMFTTALEPGEMITAIRFPVPETAGYAKFRSPASRYALVGVFVAKFADHVRVAVTGAAPSVFRSHDLETVLAENFDAHTPSRVAISPHGLNSDMHAEAAYRAHLIGVMAKRAVEAALQA